MPLASTCNNRRIRSRNKSARLVAHMRQQLDSRTAGKVGNASDPANSLTMPLFSNLADNYEGDTFVPNANLWCNDLRPQLTGVHVSAGNYRQSYGLVALGDRFAVTCGHGGPEHNGPGGTCAVKFVGADGTVATVVSTGRANASQGNQPDQGVIDAGVPQMDMKVFAFSSDIPSFIHRIPLLELTAAEDTAISLRGGEFLIVSQGNRTDSTGASNNPKNRKVYRWGNTNWMHGVTEGDSGTPICVVLNDTVYYVGIVSGVPRWTPAAIGHLNTLIAVAASRAGISPITVSLAPNPIL